MSEIEDSAPSDALVIDTSFNEEEIESSTPAKRRKPSAAESLDSTLDTTIKTLRNKKIKGSSRKILKKKTTKRKK